MNNNKIHFLQNLINKTLLSSQKYKLYDILGPNELNITVNTLENIYLELEQINEKNTNKINSIEDDIISVIKNFGTDSFEDLIILLNGEDYINTIKNSVFKDKYDVLKKFIHPINFKIILGKTNSEDNNKKPIIKNKIIDENMICENGLNLECFDLSRTSKTFQTKVYGIKIVVHNYSLNKSYIISCLVDDVILSCLDYKFIKNKISVLNTYCTPESNCNNSYWKKYINSLTLKDILVYSENELVNRYEGIINQLNLYKQKSISQLVKEFINNDLYNQRSTLINLLIKNNDNECQYLAYLLYDLLSNENNGNIDTFEQTLLYDSLPWNIKRNFREAMKQTIQYTNNLYNFDNNKIPLEQQICLLKADDSVKEKAILKLKEIKAKSEDSGSKARQYLDGLLKIPFGIVKEEDILLIKKDSLKVFSNLIKKFNEITNEEIEYKNFTNYEMNILINNIESKKIPNLLKENLKIFENKIVSFKKDQLIKIINYINNDGNYDKISISGKKNTDLVNYLINFTNKNSNDINLFINIFNEFQIYEKNNNPLKAIDSINHDIKSIKKSIDNTSKYISDVKSTLDTAVFGHEKAKRQLERIIGQWINGEKSGYCFGFEGPPGVGKTSLAKKGIANCLKDQNGNSRPFSFIAIGGSSNGSTLEGHNYTYVGSTWGRIVDILIETNCMNPIIFIDELDKISKTEHGKEIIGILTHLIDTTQNDSFQDKYFSGIDLDLSKALFIFSYNDVDNIDRILLDRIHRIKFKHLTLEEKKTITKKYLLKELFEKMGLENTIIFNNDIIEFLITTYTNEPGVRKLKELLFEITSEINLDLLNISENKYDIPYEVTIDDIKNKFLKERQEIRIKKINNENKVGVVNGLWANGVGQGGLLNIEGKFIPSGTFLELKLTGMQGDVMKESMTVSKSVAWGLLNEIQQKNYLKNSEKNKNYGLHIHVPEGATPKDGPSAGVAITMVIYSLLTERIINKDFAMTGEICLQGDITAIGGLDLKILGGIKAGATKFIYPKENSKDYNEFLSNLTDHSIIEGIEFYEVSNIKEVIDLLLI